MSIKGQEITMKPHEIAKAILTWHGGCCFSGEACGKCNVTVNTFGHAPGWFCPNCDHFNNQSFSSSIVPWGRPDYGPTIRTIHKGNKLATRNTRRRRKFADGQKVFVNLRGYPFRPHEAEWRAARIVSMRDECYSGMRWYSVVFPDGKVRMMVDEENISKRIGVMVMPGGGTVELERVTFPISQN